MSARAKTCLGDGVYVQREDSMVVLTTSDGLVDLNIIYLEPEVLAAFLAWIEKQRTARG